MPAKRKTVPKARLKPLTRATVAREIARHGSQSACARAYGVTPAWVSKLATTSASTRGQGRPRKGEPLAWVASEHERRAAIGKVDLCVYDDGDEARRWSVLHDYDHVVSGTADHEAAARKAAHAAALAWAEALVAALRAVRA